MDLRTYARGSPSGLSSSRGRKLPLDAGRLPADTISLRSVTSDNFVIIDITGEPLVIGEVDFVSALTTVHEKAIYIHGGQQYHVEHLDFKERKAYVKQVDVDYYTDAIRYTQVCVLEIAAIASSSVAGPSSPHDRVILREAKDLNDSISTVPTTGAHSRSHGDVLVRAQVVGFKKIKFFTNENVGAGKLELPENEMHTTSYWITLGRPLLESLPYSISERQSGMFGPLHALETVATLLLMCDCRDIGTAIGERPPAPGIDAEEMMAMRMDDAAGGNKEFFEPNLYLFDAYPGGIGFSDPLFRAHDLLVQKTRELIRACPCEAGLPVLRRPRGRSRSESQGSRVGHPGSADRVKSGALLRP